MLFPETWTYWPVQLFSLSKQSSIIYTDIVPFFLRQAARIQTFETPRLVSSRRTVWSRTQRWDVSMRQLRDGRWYIYTWCISGPAGENLQGRLSAESSLSPFVSLWQAGSPAELHALQKITILKVWLHIRGAVSRFLGFTFQVNWCKNFGTLAWWVLIIRLLFRFIIRFRCNWEKNS